MLLLAENTNHFPVLRVVVSLVRVGFPGRGSEVEQITSTLFPSLKRQKEPSAAISNGVSELAVMVVLRWPEGLKEKFTAAISLVSEMVVKYPTGIITRQKSEVKNNIRKVRIFSPLENLNFKLLGWIIVRNLTIGNILIKLGFEM